MYCIFFFCIHTYPTTTVFLYAIIIPSCIYIYVFKLANASNLNSYCLRDLNQPNVLHYVNSCSNVCIVGRNKKTTGIRIKSQSIIYIIQANYHRYAKYIHV